MVNDKSKLSILSFSLSSDVPKVGFPSIIISMTPRLNKFRSILRRYFRAMTVRHHWTGFDDPSNNLFIVSPD